MRKNNNKAKTSVETFYTGGGIWITEKELRNNTCAIISSDYANCLSIYKYHNEEEKDLIENMIFSKCIEEIESDKKLKKYIALYEELYNDLRKTVENYGDKISFRWKGGKNV